jgi:7,8-dihydroneopterin aldolase/epimerase/oxygenase
MTDTNRRFPTFTDQVKLEALEIEAPIGVYPHEHTKLQKLIIDLALDCDLTKAGETDDLEHAIDYDALAAIARQTATEKHHRLIETVAHQIATRILAQHKSSTRVFVRVAKPSAVPGAKCAAVEVWREREHL